MDALVRKFNIDCVILESPKDGGGVMGGVKVQDMGNLLHDLALWVFSLNLNEDVFGDIRCGRWRGVAKASVGDESILCIEKDSGNIVFGVGAGKL